MTVFIAGYAHIEIALLTHKNLGRQLSLDHLKIGLIRGDRAVQNLFITFLCALLCLNHI